MDRMIDRRRVSVCAKDHESRLAFCCISSALVATPPALDALPGAYSTPESWKYFTASGVRHIGAFGDQLHTVLDQRAGVLAVKLVLGRARQRDLARHLPEVAVGDLASSPAVFFDVLRAGPAEPP